MVALRSSLFALTLAGLSLAACGGAPGAGETGGGEGGGGGNANGSGGSEITSGAGLATSSSASGGAGGQGEGGAGQGGANAGGAGEGGGGDGGKSGGVAPEPDAFLGGFFPIAADYQHHSTFAEWKKRGVNTMIRTPPKDTIQDWTKKANELGLKMIREPRPDPKDDLKEKNLLAWHWVDEPELHGVPASKLADFDKKMAGIDPKMPIHVNFWGGGMLENPDGCYGPYCYADYVKHADFISHDIYPCNKYDCDITLVGKMTKRLRSYAKGDQEAFAYIESSDWDQNGTGPSPRRLRAEVWDAIINGARGVFYFCVALIPGCKPGDGCLDKYDATPKEVADAMKPLHATLEALSPVLQTKINPGSVSMEVKAPLEAGWRKASDGTVYFIVLNTSDKDLKAQKLAIKGMSPSGPAKVFRENREVKVNAGGEIVDDFQAYETHVYRVTP